MAGMKPLGNFVVEFDASTVGLEKGINSMKKSVTSSMKAMQAQSKVMSASGDKVGALKARQDGLKQALSQQEKVVQGLNNEYQKSVKETGATSEKSQQLANDLNSATSRAASLKSQIAQTGTQLEKMQKQAKIDASPFTKMGKQLDAIGGKMQGVGKKMSGIGKTMSMRVTAPIVAGLGASVKAAVDYEQALAGVKKTTDLSKKEMNQMSKEITNMSNTMPFAATEVAGVAEAAGQLGVKKKDITGFTKTMLNMSVATDMTSDEAATNFAKFANAAGMPMSKVDRLGSSVVALGNSTASTESDLVEMGQRLAGAGSQAGFSADQIMGLAAAMSSVGIKSEAGGSAMTQIFNKMTKAAANGGDELNSFAQTSGMSADEFAQTWENNPTKALQAFVAGLSNTKGGAAGVVQALDEVGIKGIREADTMRRLANNHEVLDKALKTSSEGWKENTALSKEAQTRYETLGSKLTVLKNNLTNFGREIGAAMAPYVESLADKFTGLIQKFQGMSLHSKQMIVIFAGIAAAIGPALVVIGTAVEKIGVLTSGFGKLSMSIGKAGGLFAWLGANPIVLIVGAIAALGTILAIVASKSDSFREKLSNAFSSLITFVQPAITAVITFIRSQIASLQQFWNENGAQFIQALQNFWAIIKPIVSIALGVIVGIVKNVWGSIKGLISGAMQTIQGIIQLFTGIFTGDFGKMWQGIKNIFFGGIQVIWNWINLQFIGRILRGIGGLASGAKGLFSGMWSSIKGFFSGGIQAIGARVVGFAKNIVSKFSGLKSGATGLIRSMWSSVRNFFAGGISSIISRVLGFANNIKNRFLWLKNQAVNLIKAMWNGVRNFFSGGISGIISRVFNFANNVKNRFLWLKNQAWNAIKSLWSGIRGTFSSGISKVVGWMENLPGRIAKGIRRGTGKVKSAFKSIFDAAKKAVGKPINGIIGGANWILDKFGVSKKKQIPSWKYAKGTGKKGHPGGDAIVNDGRGAEAVQMPNGKAFIPRGKNVFIPNAPKGMHVMNAEDTAKMQGKKHPTFRYKKGTSWWDKTKDFAGKAWEGTKKLAKKAKDKIGDIWDYMSDPGKLVGKVIDHFTNFDGMAGFALNAGKGLVGKVKGAMKSWISGLFDEYGDDGGTFDGKIWRKGPPAANGVYAYLINVAKKVMDKYSGMRFTSGYRPGDPHHHGKRQAIDIAYPASMNGSKKYEGPANYAYNNFADKVAYVITRNKIKDRTGYGGQGKTNTWKNFPAGGHLDHLHISGKYGPGDIGKGGTGKWKTQIRKAAAQMKVKISGKQINQIASMIQAESGGNQRVKQKIHDVNSTNGSGGAKGLLQYIQSTFNAYAMKGHKNIWSGFDQLLAFFNNSNWKNDISPNGGWGPRGHRRFEHGGLINRHMMAEMGEGNKPEMVLPLTNRARSLELMAHALKIMGVDKSGKTKPATNDNTATNERLDKLIEIMSNFDDDLKNLKIILDGREVTKSITSRQKSETELRSLLRGEMT